VELLFVLLLPIVFPALIVGAVAKYFGRFWAFLATLVVVAVIIIGMPLWWMSSWETYCSPEAIATAYESNGRDNDATCRSLFFGVPLWLLVGVISITLTAFAGAEVSKRATQSTG
jgi:hypothetical protein